MLIRERNEKGGVIWGLVFFTLLAAFYGFRLSFPPEPYYDEVYHVASARNILKLQAYVDVHPALGHVVHALSLLILGDHSWVWRISSLLFSVLVVFLIYGIVKELARDRLAGFFAAGFSIFECISLTQARMMMHNSQMLFFMLLSLYCLILHTESGRLMRRKAFLLSGLSLGLGFASRWVALGIAPLIWLLLAKSKKRLQGGSERTKFWKDVFWGFVLVPVAVYLASQLVIPFLNGFGWSDVWNQSVNIFRYHTHLTEGHTYGSPWWSWPFMTRPIWYFFERKEGLVRGILCIGNPAIFWVIPLVI